MQASTKPYVYYEQIINGLFNIPKNIQSYLGNVILVKNERDRANLANEKSQIAALPHEDGVTKSTFGSSLFGWFSKTETPPETNETPSNKPFNEPPPETNETPSNKPFNEPPSDKPPPETNETPPETNETPSDKPLSETNETPSDKPLFETNETPSDKPFNETPSDKPFNETPSDKPFNETPPETNETPSDKPLSEMSESHSNTDFQQERNGSSDSKDTPSGTIDQEERYGSSNIQNDFKPTTPLVREDPIMSGKNCHIRTW